MSTTLLRPGPRNRDLAASAWQSRRRRADLLTALLFLAPSLIVFGIFVYYTIGFNVYLSATSWDFISPAKIFVGLRNYSDLLSGARFWIVLKNTAYFAVASVLLSMVVGLGLALLLNQAIAGRAFFRTLLFSPYITTTAAVSLVWIWIFDPGYGLINAGLRLVGIAGPRWLSTTQWAMPALIIMNVWRTSGYTMVLFLAGLTGIDRTLLEAAQIDGAGRWSTFRNITLPLLSPTTFFVLMTSLFTAFQVFDQVAVMTSGGPVDATMVLNYYIYEQAFVTMRAGSAAATATLFFTILLVLTFIQTRLSRRWVHYQ